MIAQKNFSGGETHAPWSDRCACFSRRFIAAERAIVPYIRRTVRTSSSLVFFLLSFSTFFCFHLYFHLFSNSPPPAGEASKQFSMWACACSFCTVIITVAERLGLFGNSETRRRTGPLCQRAPLSLPTNQRRERHVRSTRWSDSDGWSGGARG